MDVVSTDLEKEFKATSTHTLQFSCSKASDVDEGLNYKDEYNCYEASVSRHCHIFCPSVSSS